MIASLTTSDLRNTLCGRLKLLKTPKLKITLSQIQSDWVFSASKKNPCYFCDFCDICGHFGALLGFFSFYVRNFVTFVIFAIFAIFVMGVLSQHEKSLLLSRFLRYLGTFRGPSWLLVFVSLEFCYIWYLCDICRGCFQLT